jgi:hypothetical protein
MIHHSLCEDSSTSLLEALLKPCCTLQVAARHRSQVPLLLSSRITFSMTIESTCLENVSASSQHSVSSTILKFIALAKLLSTFPQLSRFVAFFFNISLAESVIKTIDITSEGSRDPVVRTQLVRAYYKCLLFDAKTFIPLVDWTPFFASLLESGEPYLLRTYAAYIVCIVTGMTDKQSRLFLRDKIVDDPSLLANDDISKFMPLLEYVPFSNSLFSD